MRPFGNGDADHRVIKGLCVPSSVFENNTLSERQWGHTEGANGAVLKAHLGGNSVPGKEPAAIDLDGACERAGCDEPHDGFSGSLVLGQHSTCKVGGVHINNGEKGDGGLGGAVHAHDAVTNGADRVADAANGLLNRGRKVGELAGVEVKVVEVVAGSDGAVVAPVAFPDWDGDTPGTDELVDLGKGTPDLAGLVVGVHDGLTLKAHPDGTETTAFVAAHHYSAHDVLTYEKGLLVLHKLNVKLVAHFVLFSAWLVDCLMDENE